MNSNITGKPKPVIDAKRLASEEHHPGKHTLRLHRHRAPGSEYKVSESFPGCRINYDGLNAMLRQLGYKTSKWNPR